MSGKNTHPDAQQQCDALWLFLKESSKRRAGPQPGPTTRTPATTGGSNSKTISRRQWPSYDTVVSDITQSDYSENLRCPHDLRFLSGGNGSKTLCPHGVVCKAKIEMFDQPPSNQQQDSPQYWSPQTWTNYRALHSAVIISDAAAQ